MSSLFESKPGPGDADEALITAYVAAGGEAGQVRRGMPFGRARRCEEGGAKGRVEDV
jgi:hypothetical protein